jgi:hypothetical protein
VVYKGFAALQLLYRILLPIALLAAFEGEVRDIVVYILS